MATYDLKPIWSAILDVWHECYAICKRHDLRVFLAFGSEIGAMRHHGFIPWDDDFDVYMPRSDYNKFMKYAAEELPPYMKWHSIENDPDYELLFGKVQDERNDVRENVIQKSGLSLEQGIFVDFFPLDGLPSTKFGCFLWNVRRSILRRFFNYDGKKLQDWISKKDFDKCKNGGWLLTNFRYPRFIYKKSWFDSARLVEFENELVPVPAGVEEHLTSVYGDYMTLPPEEQRHPTHQIKPE